MSANAPLSDITNRKLKRTTNQAINGNLEADVNYINSILQKSFTTWSKLDTTRAEKIQTKLGSSLMKNVQRYCENCEIMAQNEDMQFMKENIQSLENKFNQMEMILRTPEGQKRELVAKLKALTK